LPTTPLNTEKIRATVEIMRIILIIITLFLVFTTQAYATRGCCSWHGGVDYCDSSVGRYVCNDGTYSPSCGCAYVPQTAKPISTIAPTPKPTVRPTPTPTLKPTPSPTSSPAATPGEVKGASTTVQTRFCSGVKCFETQKGAEEEFNRYLTHLENAYRGCIKKTRQFGGFINRRSINRIDAR
jgi:hypothetical protein